jgi:hypothetical protein
VAVRKRGARKGEGDDRVCSNEVRIRFFVYFDRRGVVSDHSTRFHRFYKTGVLHMQWVRGIFPIMEPLGSFN